MAGSGTPPTEERQLLDKRLVQALAHPLRHRILEILTLRVAGASDVARELDADLGVVAYHVNRLLEWDLIELVGTEYGRGGLRRVYRAQRRAMLTNEQFGQLPLSARRGIFGGVLAQIWRDIAAAAGHGGFDAPDAHVTWTRFDLDEPGYADMVRIVDACLNRAIEIQAEVAQRRADGASPADGVSTELVLLHFLRPDNGAPQPEAEPAVADPERADLYTLAEDVGDELVGPKPDWGRVDGLLDELKARLRPLLPVS